jgi:ribosomal-protein-alanine acetyltransferase rimI
MADLTYRAMTVADIPAALALWRSIPGLALDAADEPAALAAFLARNPGLSDITLADGAIIATLLCGEDGRRATFYHLAVAADWRGQGIARQLLARAEDRLRARGITKMRLLVLGDNALGNAYWPKQGWRQQTGLNYYSKSLL